MVRSALALSLVALLAGAVQAQPVTNGGFEEFDAAGNPVDWNPMGTVTATEDCHSGGRALLLTRAEDEKTETGLNRAWEPDSGKQGTMLAQLRGGVRFWYKVPAASPEAKLTFFVIAMSKRPMEDTGASRALFEVPTSHYGDGQWHQGAVVYDFSKTPDARWVHLAPRLMGGAGQWILDDVEWTETIGPWLAITRLDVLPGRDILRASIRNSGDREVTGLQSEMSAPEGVTLTPIGDAVLPQRLSPGATEHLHWRIEGDVAEGAELGLALLAADAQEPRVVSRTVLRPQLLVYSLEAAQPVLRVGDETTVRVSAYNYGPATQPDVRLQLEVPSELALVGSPPPPEDIPPRSWSSQTFTVRARSETPNALLLGRVAAGGASSFVSTSLVVGKPGGSWYELGDVRLRVGSSRWGAGPIGIEIRQGAGWRRGAWIPHLGRVVLRNAAGADETVYLAGSPRKGKPCQFDLRAEDADGGVWTGLATFVAGETRDTVRATYSLRCSEPRLLRCFEGPVVWAETQGRDALFPGLEWTEGDEVTSSALDIQLGHTDQVRRVPHPQKVTIPLMGVSDGSATVGLLWDCRMAWDGTHDRPAAFFSAPGYLEGHKQATMGLMAPGIAGGWLEENERLAATPYELPAGRVLTLEARILASAGSASSLDAVERWTRIYGIPEPSAPPRGDLTREVEFSAHAYFESLYIPEEDAWWYSKGGGPVMSKKGGPTPAYAWSLLRASNLARTSAEAELFREWAERMRAKAAEPAGVDQGLEFLAAPDWGRALLATATASAATQQPDGGWAFDADRTAGPPFDGYDYWDLGSDGEIESGTIAATAVQLLRCARVMGSQDAYDEGCRALTALEPFRVPRAAQVWEVPVHSPDILASSDAVEAYLEAYRYDGDRKWLERAVYWARTGLPFVYLWDDPERPFLRYATIPVYGASQNQWSWFGRPVQWNGLRYAGALLQLAEFDASHPWRQLAEGIVASALHQQAPDGPDKAMWPDSIGADKGDKSSWIFDPQLILEQVFTLLGQDPHPRTVILPTPGGRIHVTSLGTVEGARMLRDGLRCTVRYPGKVQGSVLFAGVTPPEEVQLNGKAVPEGETWPGWTYDASLSLLTVRVPNGANQQLLLRRLGNKPPPSMPKPVDRIDFGFDQDTEGWSPLHSVGDLRQVDGALTMDITAIDPYIQRQGLHLTGEPSDVLVLRMRSTAQAGAQIYWSTAATDYYEEARVAKLDTVSDGEWHEYRVPLGTNPLWVGQAITGMRFDPAGGGPGEVAIDSIRLERP